MPADVKKVPKRRVYRVYRLGIAIAMGLFDLQSRSPGLDGLMDNQHSQSLLGHICITYSDRTEPDLCFPVSCHTVRLLCHPWAIILFAT